MKTRIESLKAHLRNYFNHERISRIADILMVAAGLVAMLPIMVVIKDNPVTNVEEVAAIAETHPIWVTAVAQFTSGCWSLAFTAAIAAAIFYKTAHTMLWTETFEKDTAEIVKRCFGNLELPKL